MSMPIITALIITAVFAVTPVAAISPFLVRRAVRNNGIVTRERQAAAEVESLVAEDPEEEIDDHLTSEPQPRIEEAIIGLPPLPNNPAIGVTSKSTFLKGGSRRGALWAFVTAAKVQFGTLRRTEANRLCVRKFLHDLMKEKKMRLTHIDAVLDDCVELFFVRTDREIERRRLLSSYNVLRRDADYSRRGWNLWSLLRGDRTRVDYERE